MKHTTNYTGVNKLLHSDALQKLLTSKSEGSLKQFLDDWKWIFEYSKKYKWAILIYTILGILSSTLGLGSAVVTKYIIDIVVNRSVNQLWLLIFIMIFSSVFSILFSSIYNRLSAKINIFVNNDIQADIFEKIMKAEWLSLNRYANGDLLNRFSNDVRSVAANAVDWIPNIIIQLYGFIATFVVICYYDVTMALIAFLSAPFLAVSGRYFLRKTQEHKQKVLKVNSDVMTFEVESFYNYDTIKSFGATEQYNKKLKNWQKTFVDTNLDYNLFSIKANVWMRLLSTAVSLLAFGYCIFRLWSGNVTYGTMMLFLQQRSKLSISFDSLIKVLPNMVNSAVAAHRVREITELPKETHYPESIKELEPALQDGLTIQLKDVSFAYVKNENVLHKSHLTARPNEIIALIGPSGEGKTTIIRMLLGLISPQKGEAVLLTKEKKEIMMNADLRGLFSYVPQGNTLFAGTIAENLRLAKPEATEEEMIEALKTACAWDFVQKNSKGIHATVGERGRGLSEGQAQRIAIARAILRNAPVLLLDEATSALDVETERKVLGNIMKQHPNKTCIVTTHRPTVLNMCQRIYRVIDTKVTELDEKTSAHIVQEF